MGFHCNPEGTSHVYIQRGPIKIEKLKHHRPQRHNSSSPNSRQVCSRCTAWADCAMVNGLKKSQFPAAKMFLVMFLNVSSQETTKEQGFKHGQAFREPHNSKAVKLSFDPRKHKRPININQSNHRSSYCAPGILRRHSLREISHRQLLAWLLSHCQQLSHGLMHGRIAMINEMTVKLSQNNKCLIMVWLLSTHW